MLHDFQTRMAERLRPGLGSRAGRDEASAAARHALGWRVYRNNVAHAHVSALQDAYPVVTAIVGLDCLRTLALDYAGHHPAGRCLRDWTSQLAEFIEQGPLAELVPYLADVARVERAWLAAYHAPDRAVGAPPTDAVALAAAELALHPTATIVTSQHPLVSIWRWHRGEAETPGEAAEQAVVFRPRGDVEVHAVSRELAERLQAVARPMPFTALVDGMSDDALSEFTRLFMAGLLIPQPPAARPETCP